MKIAVVFPGIGYHQDKPLLYYARKLTEEYGYEKVITISYSYDGGNIRGNEKKMQQAFECLYKQAEKVLTEIAFDSYGEILFISKSVGTVIASAYAEKWQIKCRHILYTPLEQTFQFVHKDAVAFIGTADPWSDTDEVVKLAKEQQIPIHIYEAANHSLETKDVLKNLEILQDVMKKTRDYINHDKKKLVFRKAHEEEISRIIAMQEDVFGGEQGIPRNEVGTYMQRAGQCWCAEADGKIYAATAAWKEGEETHWGRFAVYPDARGRHIGTELARWSFQDLFAQGVEEIHLDARDATVKIVCSMGGKIVGEPYPFHKGNVTPMILKKEDFKVR